MGNLNKGGEMGVYDTIRIGKKAGQVKLWDCSLREYGRGDMIPEFQGHVSYSIIMREGGFVNIKKRRIEGWTQKPTHRLIFDKWGNDSWVEDDGEYLQTTLQ